MFHKKTHICLKSQVPIDDVPQTPENKGPILLCFFNTLISTALQICTHEHELKLMRII